MLGINDVFLGMKECLKCGHKWFPRNPSIDPKECPSCKNYKWHLPRTLRNSAELFWSLVEKTDGRCWEWRGGLNNKGYGTYEFMGMGYVHRISYALHHNKSAEDMKGLNVLHKCDNPKCVNPDHLFLGTQKENIRDCVEKDRNCRGERQGRSKLKDGDVLFIREEAKNKTMTQKKLAEKFGVHVNHINAIVNRIFWRHI